MRVKLVFFYGVHTYLAIISPSKTRAGCFAPCLTRKYYVLSFFLLVPEVEYVAIPAERSGSVGRALDWGSKVLGNRFTKSSESLFLFSEMICISTYCIIQCMYTYCYTTRGPMGHGSLIVQALISVQALVFDLAQLTCQKRFDCRNAILGPSAILLGTSYSYIVVAVLL